MDFLTQLSTIRQFSDDEQTAIDQVISNYIKVFQQTIDGQVRVHLANLIDFIKALAKKHQNKGDFIECLRKFEEVCNIAAKYGFEGVDHVIGSNVMTKYLDVDSLNSAILKVEALMQVKAENEGAIFDNIEGLRNLNLPLEMPPELPDVGYSIPQGTSKELYNKCIEVVRYIFFVVGGELYVENLPNIYKGIISHLQQGLIPLGLNGEVTNKTLIFAFLLINGFNLKSELLALSDEAILVHIRSIHRRSKLLLKNAPRANTLRLTNTSPFRIEDVRNDTGRLIISESVEEL